MKVSAATQLSRALDNGTAEWQVRVPNLSLARFRKAVHARAGHVCELRLPGCSGRSEHAHHILRKGQGGPNDPANGLALCHSCHDTVHFGDVARSYQEGWLKRANPRPGDFYYEGE